MPSTLAYLDAKSNDRQIVPLPKEFEAYSVQSKPKLNNNKCCFDQKFWRQQLSMARKQRKAQASHLKMKKIIEKIIDRICPQGSIQLRMCLYRNETKSPVHRLIQWNKLDLVIQNVSLKWMLDRMGCDWNACGNLNKISVEIHGD